MAKSWITKTTKFSDGSRMTTRMSVGESLFYDLIIRPVGWLIVFGLKVFFVYWWLIPLKLILGIFKKNK